MDRPGGIYLHVPYCLGKCAYCDFASRPLTAAAELDSYLAAVRAEIRRRARGPAATIYLGGGTPSLCSAAQLRSIFQELSHRIQLSADAEITLEINPATVEEAQLAAFRTMGINRLSIGIQSPRDRDLQMLGRRHTARDARQCVATARRAGFDNISADVIYGLPGQTLADFQAGLAEVACWGVEHLSLYALSLEPDTPLAWQVREGLLPAPDDDAAADMYVWSQSLLPSLGYVQYELSNFALPGKECRHNLGYWTGAPYLGLGAAAHSFEDGIRSWNVFSPHDYVQAIGQGKSAEGGREKLKISKRIAEDLMVGLRLTSGIRKRDFADRFGRDWENAFVKTFSGFIRTGLLMETAETLRLTGKGMLLANVVFRAIV